MTRPDQMFFEQGIIGMAEHVHVVSGDGGAARQRIIEARDLLDHIATNPELGTRLEDPLAGWRVRHGGRGRRISIVFQRDVGAGILYLALVAFGGQDWEHRAAAREQYFSSR